MFKVSVTFKRNDKTVLKQADKANFKNLTHAAASIRKLAASSITRAPKGKHSQKGRPPHTHRGAFFRRALRWYVEKQIEVALIGFAHSVIGEVGALHEFGESRGGIDFPKRPTLAPALKQAAPRLGDHWQGTIGR